LNDNAGVFTVATYESILRRFAGNAEDEEHTTTGATIETDFEFDRIANNLAIDLSYFERRVYDRFKLSLSMELKWKGRTYAAETRDISQSGLRLCIRMPIDVSVNDIVRINVAPSVNRQLEEPELEYRIIRIDHLLKDTHLALQSIGNEEKDGLSVITDHITTCSHSGSRAKTEPEDAILTAQAQLAERFYMRSTSVLPFFMFDCEVLDSPLRIILGNQVNQHSLRAFGNTQGNYDFSTLITPKRVKLLTRLALRNSKAETLIAVYHSQELRAPQVKADLECKNHKHWHRLLMRYAAQSGFRVFKVVARVARLPVEMRIEDALEPYIHQDCDVVSNLLADSRHLSIVGALIDVTDQIREWYRDDRNFNDSALEEPVIYCDEEQPLAPPQLIPIHYIQENRSEDRFLGQMPVEVDIGGKKYHGNTRDVSAHGLSVEIEDPFIVFVRAKQASISFPKLEAHMRTLTLFQANFRNVPAELVGGPANGEHLLRFRISDSAKGHQFAKAFSDFLTRYHAELSLDTSHSLRAAASRLYSSIFIESSSTLPAFIYYGPRSDYALKIGIASSPAPLIDYFEVAEGKFDFSALTVQTRLQHIMREVAETNSSDVILYLSKERYENAASFVIRSLADFEIREETVRTEFVRHAKEHDFRCIKITVCQPKVPPEAEIEQVIDRLAHLSPTRRERVKADFSSLVAIGDIVDITGLALDENLGESITPALA
jgi:hypothetical protein